MGEGLGEGLTHFHPHLVLLSTMNVYLKNTNIGEKRINKKRKSHTPLNPPSMGEYIEQFPSLEGCRLQRGECFSFVILGFHPHLVLRKQYEGLSFHHGDWLSVHNTTRQTRFFHHTNHLSYIFIGCRDFFTKGRIALSHHQYSFFF